MTGANLVNGETSAADESSDIFRQFPAYIFNCLMV
jgi:hypothetical protein